METRIFQPTEIDLLFSEGGNLREAIDKIEKNLRAEGKVLCELKINGMNLTPDDELNFENSDRSEINNFEIKAQSVMILLADARASLVTYLTQMKEVSVKAAEALRIGGSKDAHDMIRAVVDGTQWVTEMLSQIRALEVNYDKVERDWLVAEAEFLKSSRELLKAYEAGDMVLVADNLEYEWTTAIDQWLKVLSLLAPSPLAKDNGNE